MLNHYETMDLNGKWDFVPGYVKCENIRNYIFNGDNIKWYEIDVPYFWNGSHWMSILGSFHVENGYYKDGQVPPFKDHKGVAWYRKKLRLPEKWQDKRVNIRFTAVAAKAKVWVNGHEAGEHLGAYSKFEFDITDFVSFSGENTIVVQVWGKTCFYPDDQRTYDMGGIHLYVPGRQIDTPVGETRDNSGIYQPVELFATEQAYVEDLDVIIVMDSLKVRVNLERKYEELKTLDIEVRLIDKASESIVRKEARKTNLPEKSTVLTFVWNEMDVKRWSPENPNMYKIEVGISYEEKNLGTSYKDIGFKTFEIRDKKFYLNGKPYFLRGSGSPVSPVIVNDDEYISKFLGMCKEINLNCIRFHTEPPSQAWLKGCDEAGLLAIFEMPLMQQTPEVINTRNEFKQLVKQAKHHPCVAIYCLSNETEFMPDWAEMSGYKTTGTYFSDLRAAVLEEDNTLPVYHNAGYSEEVEGGNGDIRDYHIYGGWYSNCVYTYEPIMQGKSMMEALRPEEGKLMAPGGLIDVRNKKFWRDMYKPTILTELLAAYTDDDGHFFQYPVKVRRIGKYKDEGNHKALWYQAFLLKEILEILRRSRDNVNNLSGVSPFALFNWFFHPLEKEKLSFKPAAMAARDAMEPAHASIRCWNRHKFGTDIFNAEICLINDDVERGDIFDSKLICRIKLNDGNIVVDKVIDVDEVKYYEVKKIPVSMSIPEIAGSRIVEAVIEVVWQSGDNIISRNKTNIYLSPFELRKFVVEGTLIKAFVFDSEGKSDLLFDKTGIPYVKINKISAAESPDSVIIIGINSLENLTKEDKEQLNIKAKEGSTILVMEQDVYDVNKQDIFINWIDNTPLAIIREEDHVDDFVYVTDFNSPIFKGLEPEHFRIWNGNTTVISSYIRQGTEENQEPAKTLFGSRFGSRLNKLENIKTYIECFNFLKYDGLVEVPLGKGKIIFNQLEASRRYGDDPAATVYLNNLFKYVFER